jgi:formylglycine-generating enzyme required for sulfatase activity
MAASLPTPFGRSLSDDLAARLLALAGAWQAHAPGAMPPRWQDFLPAAGQACPPQFLTELVAIDVECRVRAGMPALLAEPYFEGEWPGRPGPEAQAEMVRWEYRLRWRRGQRARRDDYVRYFPELSGQLQHLAPLLVCPRCGHDAVPLAAEDTDAADCPGCGGAVAVAVASTVHQDTPPPPPQPSDRPASPTRLGRFDVAGEVDRGGMGAVLRAYDAELRREVAVKVLLDEHAHRPEMRSRFMEEAQIAGQLQHPGVVPVYEMGRLDQGQPYFAMKLVKGQTLADLLARRADPAADLPRFVGILEQVCQAVAYAHSKRVIHRDLKPGNVMVGAFGEVLVMDWGLAKVLADAPAPPPEVADHLAASVVRTRRTDPDAGEGGQTAVGSVLGTPPYMPPEQAAGAVDQLDQRSDVFALGAILCEILTGRPPYVAEDSWQVLYMAGLAEQAGARARLDACGADAELVALAKDCLAPRKDDRPANAGEVARRLADYQRGVQERLRRAEQERAAAVAREEEARSTARAEQARARAEQKRRRLAVALAAAVLVLVGVLAGGAGVAWEARGRLRARALLERLLDARTADVPAVVAEVSDYRRWAEPLLRQAQADAEAAGNTRYRLHASLALLQWDDRQAEYVFGRLLDAEPADVATVVRALGPYRRNFAERLWEQVQRPQAAGEGRRLRAACALAAHDPEDPRWDGVSVPVVARLVAESPVHLSHWLEGLRPVRYRLLPALQAVFRDRADGRRAERGLASNLLAEWAADRPDMLADLLMDADAGQFALLWPRFAAHGQAGQAPLLSELGREARFDWKDTPVPASWAEPDERTVRRVEAAGGLVGERFALCQTLPLAEFNRVAEALRPAGYRPSRLRPFAADGGVWAAAVWSRDGQDWRLATGLRAAEVRTITDQGRKDGFLPADVAGYLDAGKERFAVLWVRGGGKEDVRLRAGDTYSEHGALVKPLREAGLQARAFHTFVAADGHERYSGVWGPGRPTVVYWWHLDEIRFGNGGIDYGLPADVSLTPTDWQLRLARHELLAWLTRSPWAGLYLRSRDPPVPHPERHYAGTFAYEAGFEAVQVLGLEPAEHLARCHDLASRGYRPVALSVAAFPRPQAARWRAREPLVATGLVAASIWHRPVVPDQARERLAKRQATAAVALLRLGLDAAVWPLLRHRPDPRLRSYLIHRLSPLGADVRAVVARVGAKDVEVSERRALLLCLGEFGKDQWPRHECLAVLPRLLTLYRNDPDPGVHAAAGWLLRTWARRDALAGVEAALKDTDRQLQGADREVDRGGRLPAGGRRWYVNGQGQTMVVLDAREPFLMGSPRTEEERFNGPEGNQERQHRRRIGRAFALAATEVTVAQFRCFRKDHPDYPYERSFSPTDEHPINTVSWFEAAAYCNWLSRQAGIPEDQWCYAPNKYGQFDEGMRVRAGWPWLRGYRLPTEAEWEYACRAGAVTARPHGEAEDLLDKYACYAANSRHQGMLPVGSLKPNDLGLFDLLGNAQEWCDDMPWFYPAQGSADALDDSRYTETISRSQYHMLRGGAFDTQARNVRCAFRNSLGAGGRDNDVGFRPARTYP